MVFNIEQFVADRNEALFSFDWRKIVVYSVKYDIDLPEDPRRRPGPWRRRYWTGWA